MALPLSALKGRFGQVGQAFLTKLSPFLPPEDVSPSVRPITFSDNGELMDDFWLRHQLKLALNWLLCWWMREAPLGWFIDWWADGVVDGCSCGCGCRLSNPVIMFMLDIHRSYR
jgi:hypothetical protein